MKREQLFTANRLSLLCGLDRRAVEKKLMGVPVKHLKGSARSYSLSDALRALCREPADAEAAARMAALREKQLQADADAATLRNLRDAGELCRLSDAKLFWSDGRIAVRQTIERADYLSEASKRKLLTQLAAMKQKPPEACE